MRTGGFTACLGWRCRLQGPAISREGKERHQVLDSKPQAAALGHTRSLHQHKPSQELLLHVSSSSHTTVPAVGKAQQRHPLWAALSSPEAAGDFFWLCEPVQTEINTPLKRAGPSWNFILMAEKNMKCPWFAGHFLICFPLDFPRHIREVKPGADNSDLHLCGCDAVLAPADPLHPQAEEGKNRQASPCGTCLSLPAWPMSENFSQDDGIAESTKKKKKKITFHFHSTKSPRAQGVSGQHSQAHGMSPGAVLCKARN